MKASVLARPNLKLFLVGAMFIAAIESIMTNDYSPGIRAVNARSASDPGEDEMVSLLRQARTNPRSDLYVRISHVYEQRRDFKRALFYYREADRLAELEEQ